MTPTEYLFDRDIFLKTEHSVATGSLDAEDWRSGSVNDYTDGTAFALELQSVFPGKRSLIDLGTGTGQVPLTMRRAGMLAVGLEGSDMPRSGIIGGPTEGVVGGKTRAAGMAQLGAWGEMPECVRTCDVGKAFSIVDTDGNPVTFDLITTWGVLEHLPESDIRECLVNVDRLMGADSIGIHAIDFGYNIEDKFHMLWADFQGDMRTYLRSLLSEFFVVDEELSASRDWQYCRPAPHEIEQALLEGSHKHSGRCFFWLRKK